MDVPSTHHEPANDGCLIRIATVFDRGVVQAVLDECIRSGEVIQDIGDAGTLLATQRVYLAFSNERAVGFIVAARASVTVLHSLIVLPKERQKGFACELIAGALAELSADDGIDAFWAAVDPRLPGAHERFVKHGFLEVDMPCDGLRLMMRRADKAGSGDMRTRLPHVRSRAIA